jgi:UDPglucose 6-dehydrogenase
MPQPKEVPAMSLKITVVGTGYVGLVSGVCFAAIGHQVTCVDNNAYKIKQLENGEIPIYEPGLDKLVKENVAAGRLNFSQHLEENIEGRDAIFIAVGTPTASDGISADLSAVHAVARSLAPHLKNYTVIVTKSTVPVLTNKNIEETIHGINPQANFDICSNPEFLREGNAIEDFMKPDRIVVGIRTDKAKKVLEKLYAPLTDQQHRILFTTPESAELIKYASNALLATKIAFINEVANLAEATNGSINDIAKGVGLDTRIGEKFLMAGPGYGGSCFPKDTRAFAHMGQQYGVPSQIIEAVIQSNDDRKKDMAHRIIKAAGGDVKNKKIGILGVTFKANTDDMRDSVALDIIPQLLQARAEIHAYDPAAGKHAIDLLPQSVFWHSTADDVTTDTDILVLLTEWPEFKKIDLKKAKKKMRGALLIDLRNFYKPQDALEAGFTYHCIGHTPRQPKGDNVVRMAKS